MQLSITPIGETLLEAAKSEFEAKIQDLGDEVYQQEQANLKAALSRRYNLEQQADLSDDEDESNIKVASKTKTKAWDLWKVKQFFGIQSEEDNTLSPESDSEEYTPNHGNYERRVLGELEICHCNDPHHVHLTTEVTI
jgi:hypothetical protein